MGNTGIIGPYQIILLGVFFLLLGLPTIIALIDVLKNKFEGNDKIIWLLVVLCLNLLGAILYFTIGRKQRVLTY